MRKFNAYGPIDKDIHYYAPREKLVNRATEALTGEYPNKGGHFFTVWAPRQTGKTWVMKEAVSRINSSKSLFAIYANLEICETLNEEKDLLDKFVRILRNVSNIAFPKINKWSDLDTLFIGDHLPSSIALVLDEFDAINTDAINRFTRAFRSININRDTYQLHSLALVGVRSVVGIDSTQGSPFNVQRSLHVPNLTFAEVSKLYDWYQQESGQTVQPDVVKQLFNETQGQPGLVSWLGELLTERYNDEPSQAITMREWAKILKRAQTILPNNNFMNLIAKAKNLTYRSTVNQLFDTTSKKKFSFHQNELNYLYMHGVIDYETVQVGEKEDMFVKFACPLIQRVLFSAFGEELVAGTRPWLDPTDDLSDAIDEKRLIVKSLLHRFRVYLTRERQNLFKDSPRRKDGRIYEIEYHFRLYHFLTQILQGWELSIHPEFPTGNGKVDLLIKYQDKLYALELKSFLNVRLYQQGLAQTARYAKQLGLKEINICVFIEGGDQEFYQKLEEEFYDPSTGINVIPTVISITD